jgi:hypothetical protein
MQKNAAKQQYRGRKRFLLHQRYGKIRNVIESRDAIPTVAARTKRVQKVLLKQSVVIGILEKTDRRLLALRLANHPRIVESINGRSDHWPTETADDFCKLVGEGRLPRPVNSINCNPHNPIRCECSCHAGNRGQQICALRHWTKLSEIRSARKLDRCLQQCPQMARLRRAAGQNVRLSG